MTRKRVIKNTLNLPETDFAMKVNLTPREPQMCKAWEKDDICKKLLSSQSACPFSKFRASSERSERVGEIGIV